MSTSSEREVRWEKRVGDIVGRGEGVLLAPATGGEAEGGEGERSWE